VAVYRGREFPYTFLRSPLDPVLLSLDHSSTQYPILGNRSDMEWLFLTSKNVGWARIGLNHRLVQPSFFHEIHCLRMLNLALHRDPSASAHHSRHCLHYARSMALCHADVTLEPVVHINDSVAMWDTTQATHVCKDWSALYRGMDENWEQWKTRA
jgi:hypothetical protein